MNAHATEEDSVWKQIEPHLDDAMEKLGEPDRTALVLRYLENKSLREVGSALGTSEDAAQKRVSRALEKLKAVFTRRRIGVSTNSLAGGMSAFGVLAVPATLKGAIVATACSATTAAVGGGYFTTTLMNVMTMTKTKIAVSAAVAMIAAQFVVHQNTTRQLRNETEALRAVNVQLQNQEPEIVADPVLTAELARLRNEAVRLREDAVEVHELRGVSTALRRENEELKAMIKPVSAASSNGTGAEGLEESEMSNPMARKQFGNELVRAGKYEEALGHLLWCFDEGAEEQS